MVDLVDDEELLSELQDGEGDDLPPEPELDQDSADFVNGLVDKIVEFMDVLVGHKLRPYQLPLARRIIESVIIEDAEEITALFSRQSGKSETVCNVVATLMVLLPRLARLYPDVLGKFKDGFWVGVFAPVEGQAETLFSRIVDRLTSEHAMVLLQDPEIDDRPVGSSRAIRLKKSGSMCLMMTANPRAKIESKTFHLAVIDEAQDCDDYVVRKSIHPMLASTAGTIVKTGTPTTHKGDFYKAIQLNKRRQTARGRKVNHFEADWKLVAKHSPIYGKSVRRDMLRMGEDSDEFQMSYCLRWLLERGMFTTSAMMESLGDLSQETVRQWHRTPVVVGIDPARKLDSTVVTVVWVDWDRPDEFGFFDHRVLNWLEIRGDDWEEQYFQIVNFLSAYDVLAIGVDSGGVGDAVAQRLALLMPRAELFPLSSSPSEQSKRWKHLMALMQRGMIGWPAHAKTRRLRSWRRFQQQMMDAEKIFKGPNIMIAAPDEAEAHDDYVDSLAIACSMTLDLTLPEVQVTSSPFYARSR